MGTGSCRKELTQATLSTVRKDRKIKGFVGMTQPTSSGEAVWETWYSTHEVFGPAQPQGLATGKLAAYVPGHISGLLCRWSFCGRERPRLHNPFEILPRLENLDT